MTFVNSAVGDTEVKLASKFEHSLLLILNAVFDGTRLDEALPFLKETRSRPQFLSHDALDLVKDSLAKGCISFIVHHGGSRQEKYLCRGIPCRGRLWQRYSLDELQLDFSQHSLEFLLVLASQRPGTWNRWHPPLPELTLADRLLQFLVYRSLRHDRDSAQALKSHPHFLDHALIRLCFPLDFLEDKVMDRHGFAFWMDPKNAFVLEALQDLLAQNWYQMEIARSQISSWVIMHQQGLYTAQILNNYLDEAEHRQRRDLTIFLLSTLQRLLSAPDISQSFWTAGLLIDEPLTLKERLEVLLSATSILSICQRFSAWERLSRQSRFMDDDYAQNQYWLEQCEKWGLNASTQRASIILREIQPL